MLLTTHAPGPFLLSTGDRTPVEQAVASSVLKGMPPETWVCFTFPLPDGGLRVRYGWTAGGVELGDRTDREALAIGLDCADHLHITDLHCQTSHRGQIRIDAHPLRQLLADVQAGVRCPDERRDGVRRVIDCAAARTGQTARPGMPRWLGVGPALLNRKA
ncbi:hypothetical protein [Streptomyces mirabilis]|uniref:hypothetical protein n=1 Tax=Streptomyces mirabilis TaxID=68239 RepID=UPI00225411E0|nr:hypothetical protein [Streptomyces mirabilis]MCX4609483.1 hypothetical protein [Streptomyces mirabilis]